jgi:hypothetical protein
MTSNDVGIDPTRAALALTSPIAPTGPASGAAPRRAVTVGGRFQLRT